MVRTYLTHVSTFVVDFGTRNFENKKIFETMLSTNTSRT